jgi:ribose transport system substrate-binding protein
MMRRIWLCAALMGLLATLGCTGGAGPAGEGGSAAKKRLIFLTNGDDPFWDTCNAGLKEGAKEFNIEAAGYTVVMDKGNFKPDGQIDKLRQYATEDDVVGVAISVVQADNKAIIDEMERLRKLGKVVITVDGDVNRERFREARPYYIGTDNVAAGGVLGKAVKTILTKGRSLDKGGYVQFAGFTDNDNARSRMNGVEGELKEFFTQLDRKPDEGDRNKARDNVRTALDNEGQQPAEKIVSLIGIWAYNAPAIADVVAERKARDRITVGVFDAASDAIQAMGDGNIDAMCVQNPFDMGRQAVRLLKALCEDDKAVVKEMYPNEGQPEGDIFTTGLRVVVPNDKSPVKASDFDTKTVEFMTLEQFQQWLAKYGLKSS